MTSTNQNIADVQNQRDTRNIAINQVGIKGLRHLVYLQTQAGDKQQTVASSTLSVSLKADVKGTHMSRFVELIENNHQPLTVNNFKDLLSHMVERLDAKSGQIVTNCTYFMSKQAPISKVNSMLDYDIQFSGQIAPFTTQVDVRIVVPVTSLCPCSKEISEYGAHNQRSHVTVTLRLLEDIALEEIIQRVEKHASCELYGLLKRADEKYVTEKAYDNPKFVEDIVRDVAVEFNNDQRIAGFKIESENFESIHNHSAYAMIDKLS